MTLPFRDWTDLVIRTLKCQDDNNTCNIFADFTTDHIEYGIVGNASIIGGLYAQWWSIVKSKTIDLPEGLDDVVDYGINLAVLPDQNTPGCTQFRLGSYTMRYPNTPNTWDKDLVNGKYYDGVNQWGGYPQHGSYRGVDNWDVTIANLPASSFRWIASYDAGHWGNTRAPYFVRNGLCFAASNYVGCGVTPWAAPNAFSVYFIAYTLRMNYLNAVVNSISRPWIYRNETPRIVLTGLGFNQADSELNDVSRSSANSPGTAWNSIVDYIYFEGLQGQGTFQISRMAGDFLVTSDTKIVIINTPVLPIGTYDIRLKKTSVGVAGACGDVESYAGDWRADATGRCSAGSRFRLLVCDEAPKKEGSMILTKWGFKKGDIMIWKYYAPIDVYATDVFYEGRIIGEGVLTKATDDNTGLPSISDMNIELSNNDKEFSKLLAEYMCDDQVVEIFHAWRGQKVEGWKTSQVRMIVDDWSLEGTSWKVLLKDITQKYFQIKVPRYMITLDEYPNAHESALTKAMPEAIGRCYLAGETPGALEAYLVDATTHKYLALRGSAHAITQVYSNYTLQVEGAGNDYTITYEDGGRTYINFNAAQGDNKITFNCEGYMLAEWNSANGYVQNPAYVIAFLVALLAEVPADFIDLSSIDVLASLFEDLGWDEHAYLILQDFQGLDAALSELLFTFGVKMNIDKLGRMRFMRKDKSNYQTNIMIFEQIDCISPPAKSRNRKQAFNRVQAVFNHYPTANIDLGSKEDQRAAAIEDFGCEIFPSGNPLKFPWTDLEDVVVTRLGEELSKRAYGDKKCVFPIPIDWIDDLDILTNFKLQDRFGLNPTGAGEEFHYYYPDSIAIDWRGAKLDVNAVDLQWLVGQCMIIGKRAELVRNYNDASEWQKIFGYIGRCVQGTFENGDPNKQICKCG